MSRRENSRHLFAGLAGAALLVGASAAQAATTTTTFQVTATVVATCTVTATALAFGNYSGAQVDMTSTITPTCSNTLPYNVGLDAGAFSGATTSTRRMTGPSGAALNYSLFTNAGRTTNWGNVVGTDTVPGTGNGAAQPLTVFGRIPASQFSTAGAYTDTITVTVTF